jgi:hypothetical protein
LVPLRASQCRINDGIADGKDKKLQLGRHKLNGEILQSINGLAPDALFLASQEEAEAVNYLENHRVVD